MSISYPTLVSSPLSLGASIGKRGREPNPRTLAENLFVEEAFGSNPKCLGIIIIRDLPASYVGYRERLLKLAYKFAQLDENARERYADPVSRYRCVCPPFASITSVKSPRQLRVVTWKGLAIVTSYFRVYPSSNCVRK